MINVCVVGYGMTGAWHTDALKAAGCHLRTLVGRRPEATANFAARHGYERWTTSLAEGLEDEATDAVILANPSELHADSAIAALEHGKATLVEIPIAMNLRDAERVVATAQRMNAPLGVVHPTRMQPEFVDLRERVIHGTERIRQVGGRFYIERLENVGASGYARSWTDNLLWHHINHLVDFGLWLLGGETHLVYGSMSPPDPNTGIPMDVVFAAESEGTPLVCTGSYYGRERLFENLVITNRNSYRLDSFGDVLMLGQGGPRPGSWVDNNARVTRDFVDAVRQGRPPAITGESVLPAMRLLQHVQDHWDETHGARSLPGRPLPP